jgi:hypothetical protein
MPCAEGDDLISILELLNDDDSRMPPPRGFSGLSMDSRPLYPYDTPIGSLIGKTVDLFYDADARRPVTIKFTIHHGVTSIYTQRLGFTLLTRIGDLLTESRLPIDASASLSITRSFRGEPDNSDDVLRSDYFADFYIGDDPIYEIAAVVKPDKQFTALLIDASGTMAAALPCRRRPRCKLLIARELASLFIETVGNADLSISTFPGNDGEPIAPLDKSRIPGLMCRGRGCVWAALAATVALLPPDPALKRVLLITDGIANDGPRAAAAAALLDSGAVLDVLVLTTDPTTPLLPLVRLSGGHIFRIENLAEGVAIASRPGFADLSLRTPRKGRVALPDGDLDRFAIGPSFDVSIDVKLPISKKDCTLAELPPDESTRGVRLRKEFEDCNSHGLRVLALSSNPFAFWRAFVRDGRGAWWDLALQFPEEYPAKKAAVWVLTPPRDWGCRRAVLYRGEGAVLEILGEIREEAAGWALPEKVPKMLRDPNFLATLGANTRT